MFASFQSKAASVEGDQLLNFAEKKIQASNAGDVSTDNPYQVLVMIVQQRNQGVQIRFTTVDGYLNGPQCLMPSSSIDAYQFKKLPPHFRSRGLLLIFPKHYFL